MYKEKACLPGEASLVCKEVSVADQTFHIKLLENQVQKDFTDSSLLANKSRHRCYRCNLSPGKQLQHTPAPERLNKRSFHSANLGKLTLEAFVKPGLKICIQ